MFIVDNTKGEMINVNHICRIWMGEAETGHYIEADLTNGKVADLGKYSTSERMYQVFEQLVKSDLKPNVNNCDNLYFMPEK